MLSALRGVSVFAYGEPCDMRKSFNTLHALVEGAMKRDIATGDLFVFVSKSRKRAKVLYFDGTGLCLFCKRLETGKFAAPWLLPSKLIDGEAHRLHDGHHGGGTGLSLVGSAD